MERWDTIRCWLLLVRFLIWAKWISYSGLEGKKALVLRPLWAEMLESVSWFRVPAAGVLWVVLCCGVVYSGLSLESGLGRGFEIRWDEVRGGGRELNRMGRNSFGISVRKVEVQRPCTFLKYEVLFSFHKNGSAIRKLVNTTLRFSLSLISYSCV